MRLVMFSVYDSKTEIYLTPFYMLSRGAAVRAFGDHASKPDSDFGRHPADYTLFELGEFWQDTGEVKMHEARVNLGTALDLLPQVAES